ncbi:ATP-binding cassette domain-containing protein ['Fragaria x ananassa' phyllody phytoplasma]|uniref:ATP-binding cassette domain-containing protein n=1 Tax='Fragaria x ananassa' phyllody phytoplasma TaxID=2358428 RepID=A0ABS5K2Z6_9MOLU|nr:ATP-binding cassette domain-containing protein ['Fragaria x ananassa' phyllody phytoplasma]MBS2126272.1 ATP-binding cassette domain-containing protein ['Fragaria x ananassa' phyllody phytoplasma]
MDNTYGLKDVSFSLSEKGLIFITGKSGSGKSTLLNLLGGLDYPTQGNIYVYDQNITFYSNAILDFYR